MGRSIYNRLPHRVQMGVGRIIGLVPSRWRQRRISRQVTRFIKESEYWPLEKWNAYQDQKVRDLVRDAYERVPYYRETWKEAGVHPSDIDGTEALTILPTINNRIVREHFQAMTARDADLKRTIEMSTGGTTGAPTRFLMHRRAGQDSERAYIQAMWRRVGYQPGDRRIILRGAVIPGAEQGRIFYYDGRMNAYWFSNFHLTEENLGRLVELVRSFKPLFLHTYPSAVAVFCQYLQRRGIKDLPPIRAVLASSETVYPGQREFVRRTLNTRFYSWYGHAEHLILGGECEYSTDYHVFPGYGFFELLNEDGRRLTEKGADGELVGTSFYNPVMPMIRYRTGDRAELAGEGCPSCGRWYPLIRNTRGHYYQDMMVGADGRLISTTAVNVHDHTFENVLQYQYHQKRRGSVILKVVPADNYTKADEERIRATLEKRLGDLKLEIKCVEGIPSTSRGKWKYLIQELDMDLDWMRCGER